MRNLTATLCLTVAMLLGSMGVSWGADFQKGLDAYDSEDYATALREFHPLAEQGLADAQTELGDMYYWGYGVTQDYKTAAKWFTLAAEQRNAYAQYSLGWMYENGEGVPQNDKTAVKWYTLAAEQGYADAQYNLGLMYENGEGVAQDDDEAMKWYRLATEQGNADAQKQYGDLVLKDFVYGSDIQELEYLRESVGTLCKQNIKCAFDKVWTYLDITKDDHLSLSEIARFQRNIVKFAAVHQDHNVLKTGEIVAINLASIIFLPITASSVLHSFDYDNDGLLSKTEVFGDTEFSKLVGVDVDTLSTGLDFQSLGEKLKDAMNSIPFLR